VQGAAHKRIAWVRSPIVFARGLISGCVAAAATFALAGCGDSDPSSAAGKRSPTRIVVASQEAAQRYASVLVSGLVPDTGGRVRVDVHITRGKGAVGTISDKSYNLEVVRIGQSIYLKSEYSNFYERLVDRKDAAHLLGRWIHASVNAGSLIRTVSSFTELSNLTRGFFGQPGRLSMGGMTGVVGINAVEVENDATNEVLYVATQGIPYPAQILKAGAQPNEGIAFDHWNRSVSITAPPDAVDIEEINAKA
jgi:hypothetical protein